MRVKVNCRYFNGVHCSHPKQQKLLGLFTRVCIELGRLDKCCPIAKRLSRPEAPKGQG